MASSRSRSDRNRGAGLPSGLSDEAFGRLAARGARQVAPPIEAPRQARTAAVEAAWPLDEQVRFASLAEVASSGFERIASGLYREAGAKVAHPVWDLRKAEEGEGYLLVRRVEDRLVDLRRAGMEAAVDSGMVQRIAKCAVAEDEVPPDDDVEPHPDGSTPTGPGMKSAEKSKCGEDKWHDPSRCYYCGIAMDHEDKKKSAQIEEEEEAEAQVPWPPEYIDISPMQYWWAGQGDVLYYLYSTNDSMVDASDVSRAISQLQVDLSKAQGRNDTLDEGEDESMMDTEMMIEELQSYLAQHGRTARRVRADKECEECGGTGAFIHYSGPNGSERESYTECHKCDGTGRGWEEEQDEYDAGEPEESGESGEQLSLPHVGMLVPGMQVLAVRRGQVADAIVMMVNPEAEAVELMFGDGQQETMPIELVIGGAGDMMAPDDGMLGSAGPPQQEVGEFDNGDVVVGEDDLQDPFDVAARRVADDSAYVAPATDVGKMRQEPDRLIDKLKKLKQENADRAERVKKRKLTPEDREVFKRIKHDTKNKVWTPKPFGGATTDAGTSERYDTVKEDASTLHELPPDAEYHPRSTFRNPKHTDRWQDTLRLKPPPVYQRDPKTYSPDRTKVNEDDTDHRQNIRAVLALATPEEKAFYSHWYKFAHAAAVKLAERYDVPIEIAAGAIAVLSPLTDWNTNLYFADRALALDWKNVRSISTVARAKAYSVVVDHDLSAIGGQKVVDFYRSVLDPERFEHLTVVDTHAYNIWAGNRTGKAPSISDEMYKQVSEDYAAVAAENDMTPQALQALTWTIWRQYPAIGQTKADALGDKSRWNIDEARPRYRNPLLEEQHREDLPDDEFEAPSEPEEYGKSGALNVLAAEWFSEFTPGGKVEVTKDIGPLFFHGKSVKLPKGEYIMEGAHGMKEDAAQGLPWLGRPVPQGDALANQRIRLRGPEGLYVLTHSEFADPAVVSKVPVFEQEDLPAVPFKGEPPRPRVQRIPGHERTTVDRLQTGEEDTYVPVSKTDVQQIPYPVPRA